MRESALNQTTAYKKVLFVLMILVACLFSASARTEEETPASISLKEGWPQRMDGYVRSSPVLAPLRPGGPWGLFVGALDRIPRQGSLYGWRSDGSPALSDDPVAFRVSDRIYSSPAVADLDGDGSVEIIFGSDDGRLHILSLESDQQTLPVLKHSQSFILPGETDTPYSFEDRDEFPEQQRQKQVILGGAIYSTPAIGQLDDDPELEMVIGAENGFLFALNPDGTLVEGNWPIRLEGLIRSSAALGDLDGDGYHDVVIGDFAGKIHAFDRRGNLMPGFPVQTGGTITSSAALANLDQNPETLEIVIGSSDGVLYALDYEGNPVAGNWHRVVHGGGEGIRNDVDSSPAIADFDGDGRMEIVVGSDGGYIHAFDHQGNYLPGWPIATGGEVFSSAAIADLDGDSIPDILIGSDVGDIPGSRSSILYGLRADGTALEGFPVVYSIEEYGETRLRSSPLVMDWNEDGRIEIATAIYLLDEGAGQMFVYELPGSLESPPWQMFRQNPARRGLAPISPVIPTVTPTPTSTETPPIPPPATYTNTPTPTATPSDTPVPTATETYTLTPTVTSTATAMATETPSPTPSVTATATSQPDTPTPTPSITPSPIPTEPGLVKGDFNLDGRLGMGDLTFFYSLWQMSQEDHRLAALLDLNRDGVVDHKDLYLWLKEKHRSPVLFPPPVIPLPLTLGEDMESQPSFSPDGKRLAFMSLPSGMPHVEEGGFADCRIIELGGPLPQKPIALTRTETAEIELNSPIWSHDYQDSHAVYLVLGGEFSGISRIPLDDTPLPIVNEIEGPLTTPPLNLVSNLDSDIFAFSRVASLPHEGFAYFRYRFQEESLVSELVVHQWEEFVIFSATSSTFLYDNPEWGLWHGMEGFFFDGPGQSNPETRQIYFLDFFDRILQPLTDNEQYSHWYPAVAVEGQRLAFVSNRGGVDDIWLSHPDHPEQAINVTRSIAYDLEPALSDDGALLAFSSDRSGIQKIYILPLLPLLEPCRLLVHGESELPAAEEMPLLRDLLFREGIIPITLTEDPRRLSDLDLSLFDIIWLKRNRRGFLGEEIESLLQYLEQGGSLLLTQDPIVEDQVADNTILNPLGLAFHPPVLPGEAPAFPAEPHPILEGVESLLIRNYLPLQTMDETAYQGVPLVLADDEFIAWLVPFGEGVAIALGDDDLFSDDLLDQASNRRFAQNLFRFLKRPPLPPPTPTATATPTTIPTHTATPSETPVPTATVTLTPIPTEVDTATPTPRETPTPEPTATETPTLTPTEVDTATPTPSETPEPTATETPTLTPTEVDTATPTPSETPEPTATETPTLTPTEVDTATPTPSETPVPTATSTPTETATPTPIPEYRYRVTEIGLPDQLESRAYGINASGQVTGWILRSDQHKMAFSWEDGELVALSPVPGGTESEAYAINRLGQMAGWAQLDYGDRHAFVFNDISSVEDLQTLIGTQGSSQARGINDRRQVVGSSDSLSGYQRAFLHTPGEGMIDLQTLGGGASAAYDINNSTQIVGWAEMENGRIRAFKYNDGDGMWDLGVIGTGNESIAYAINEWGLVVGESEVSPGIWHAFLESDGMISLGTLGGESSAAFGLNDNAAIVGSSQIEMINGPDALDMRAFLYEEGQMLDLNDLIPPDSEWILYSAEDINNLGQIVGWGDYQGQIRAFLLTPVEIPSPSRIRIDLNPAVPGVQSEYAIDLDAGPVIRAQVVVEGVTNLADFYVEIVYPLDDSPVRIPEEGWQSGGIFPLGAHVFGPFSHTDRGSYGERNQEEIAPDAPAGVTVLEERVLFQFPIELLGVGQVRLDFSQISLMKENLRPFTPELIEGATLTILPGGVVN